MGTDPMTGGSPWQDPKLPSPEVLGTTLNCHTPKALQAQNSRKFSARGVRRVAGTLTHAAPARRARGGDPCSSGSRRASLSLALVLPFSKHKTLAFFCGGFGGAEDLKASQRHGKAEAVALSGSRILSVGLFFLRVVA